MSKSTWNNILYLLHTNISMLKLEYYRFKSSLLRKSSAKRHRPQQNLRGSGRPAEHRSYLAVREITMTETLIYDWGDRRAVNRNHIKSLVVPRRATDFSSSLRSQMLLHKRARWRAKLEKRKKLLKLSRSTIGNDRRWWDNRESARRSSATQQIKSVLIWFY